MIEALRETLSIPHIAETFADAFERRTGGRAPLPRRGTRRVIRTARSNDRRARLAGLPDVGILETQ